MKTMVRSIATVEGDEIVMRPWVINLDFPQRFAEAFVEAARPGIERMREQITSAFAPVMGDLIAQMAKFAQFALDAGWQPTQPEPPDPFHKPGSAFHAPIATQTRPDFRRTSDRPHTRIPAHVQRPQSIDRRGPRPPKLGPRQPE